MVDPDDPSTWLVSFAGIGPLLIGGAISAPVTGVTMDPPVEGVACRSFTAQGIQTLTVAPGADVDVIGTVFVSSGPGATGAPTTEPGIGTGSTEQDLVATYPDAVLADSELGRSYSITDGGSRYIHFSIAEGVVTGLAVLESPELPYEFCG